MNLQSFRTRFDQDAITRARFTAALATQLRQKGLESSDVNITVADNEITVQPAVANDPLLRLQVADAAFSALQQAGITDLSGARINPIGPDPMPFDAQDLVAWNVVYKDGGWVVNG